MIRVLFLLFALAAPVAAQERFTLAEVCPGYTVAPLADRVEIRCPGQPSPWLTIIECRNAVAEAPRPRRLYVDLSLEEENNLHGWVNYYRAHPELAALPTKIVLTERTAARLAQVSAQFVGNQNLVIRCGP